MLVLAASAYQLDVIRAAKQLGVRTVTTDNQPSNPGHQLADVAYSIDTTDQDSVLELARTERIDGVIAAATDVAVPTAAYVSEQLGLPGVGVNAARKLTDKLAFRQLQDDLRLPAPEYFEANELDRERVRISHGHWLVKPNRSSGSKGIQILNEISELDALKANAEAHSLDDRAVFERFLEGSQHTLEGVLDDGIIGFHVITDRMTVRPPFVATRGHRVPSTLDPRHFGLLTRQIEALCMELGLQDCVFDCDFVSCAEGPVILEIAPRLGGNSLSRLIRAALRVDLAEYAVRLAIGDPARIPEQVVPRPAAIVLLGADTPGTLEYDRLQLSTLGDEPWVRSIEFDVPVGTAVEPFTDGRSRVGEGLILADSTAELDFRMDELLDRLKITTTGSG